MFAYTDISAEYTAAQPIGLEPGTQVLTLKGARAVETLCVGDRVITRKGAASLRALMDAPTGGYALCFDAPQVVLLAEGQIHSDTGLPFAA